MSLLRLLARPAPRTLTRAFSTTPASKLARMTIVGRLAAEPEPVATSTAKDLTRYAVATSYGPADNRQTSYFRVTCFDEGPKRDYLLGLPKGTLVYVEGDATIRNYDDAEGKRQSSLNVVQRTLEVLKRGEPRNQEAESQS
ncbi:MAG: ssDNA-binding protein, mitochondrial [Candelina submexicana]|nr:MAG: ssDNA-binding protein, mitochondrial [Candelina submexicana]